VVSDQTDDATDDIVKKLTSGERQETNPHQKSAGSSLGDLAPWLVDKKDNNDRPEATDGVSTEPAWGSDPRPRGRTARDVRRIVEEMKRNTRGRFTSGA
jgi:hypothetical protein